MVSFINTPIHFCVSQKPISHLTPSPGLLVLNRKKQFRRGAHFNLFLGKKRDFFGFLELSREQIEGCNSWRCLCKGNLESEGEYELETAILQFMEKSSKPGQFPSKKELVAAGRFDLVEAIKKKGGWFLLGWESDEENVGAKVTDFDVIDFQRRVQGCKGGGSLGENEYESWQSFSYGSNSSSRNSADSISQSASSSGRSL